MMGVGETALRLNTVEANVNGRDYSEALLEDVAASLSSFLMPNTDLHASAKYRLYLAGQLLKRTFKAAWDMASAER